MILRRREKLHCRNIKMLKSMAHPKTAYVKKASYIEACIERDILYFECDAQLPESQKIRDDLRRATARLKRPSKSSPGKISK